MGKKRPSAHRTVVNNQVHVLASSEVSDDSFATARSQCTSSEVSSAPRPTSISNKVIRRMTTLGEGDEAESARLDMIHAQLTSGGGRKQHQRHAHSTNCDLDHDSSTSMFTARDSSVGDSSSQQQQISSRQIVGMMVTKPQDNHQLQPQQQPPADSLLLRAVICRIYLPSSLTADSQGHGHIVEIISRAIASACLVPAASIKLGSNPCVANIGSSLVCHIVLDRKSLVLKLICRRVMFWDDESGIALPFELLQSPSALFTRVLEESTVTIVTPTSSKTSSPASSCPVHKNSPVSETPTTHPLQHYPWSSRIDEVKPWSGRDSPPCFKVRSIRIPGECFIVLRESLPENISRAMEKCNHAVSLRWARTYTRSDCFVHLEYDAAKPSLLPAINSITSLVIQAVQSMACVTIEIPLPHIYSTRCATVRAQSLSFIVEHENLAAWVYRSDDQAAVATSSDAYSSRLHSIGLGISSHVERASLSSLPSISSSSSSPSSNTGDRVCFIPRITTHVKSWADITARQGEVKLSLAIAMSRINRMIQAAMVRSSITLVLGHCVWPSLREKPFSLNPPTISSLLTRKDDYMHGVAELKDELERSSLVGFGLPYMDTIREHLRPLVESFGDLVMFDVILAKTLDSTTSAATPSPSSSDN